MGNQQGSALGDEPNQAIAQRNLQHFDHSYKGEIHTTSGFFVDTFGAAKFAKRPISVTCKGSGVEIIEDVGITSKKTLTVSYEEMTGLAWDHANSEVKMNFRGSEDHYIILILSNSVEFEGELKMRLSYVAGQTRGMKIPSPIYIGMFAGAHKPKPFQRKRPNLSYLPAGKLPTLHDMRNSALELHRGSYRPCNQGESRRRAIALQHIYEGHNTFNLINVKGAPNVANQFRGGAQLLITDDALLFKPRGDNSDLKVEFFYDDIADWTAIDNDAHRSNDSGVEVTMINGEQIFFGVEHIRDVKHSLEYFWNQSKVEKNDRAGIKLGSTHGRPIVSVQTLSGEIPPGEPVTGQSEVVDQDGIIVRPGGRIAPRRSSLASGTMNIPGSGSKEPAVVPPENRAVKKHWHKLVLHQGWLLKQGGVGLGAAKAWIKRYFVLYRTSQGHFLVYYSDFTECPLYSSEKNHRNIVDLAKATFIRPGSNKQDNPDTPPYCFDIVTTEREWTLCAESQENVLKWLRLLTRGVDEDVAILPDEELVFRVKPKADPSGVLPATDYSTTLRVSAHGVSVRSPDVSRGGETDREHYFWVYTDFYKWSLVCPGGKYALVTNVFADSSFSRRLEFIFRTKDAHRLATAIEFFIEKFMTVMHIRLETGEGAAEDIQRGLANGIGAAPCAAAIGGNRLHDMEDGEDGGYDEDAANMNDAAAEMDLLNLDGSIRAGGPATSNGGGDVDLFGMDPFAAPPAVTSKPPASNNTNSNNSTNNSNPVPKPQTMSLLDDLMGDDLIHPPPAVSAVPTSSAPPSAAGGVDLFGDDPFGGDPFGGGFGAPSASSSAAVPPAVKLAPPLTAQQQSQHQAWFMAALSNAGGPLYDDGTLQLACKVEVRGSQCRVTLSLRNNSPAALSNLSLELTDPAGLLRVKWTNEPASSLSGLGSGQCVLMAECMKPVTPGPSLSLSYLDPLQGKRTHALSFPLIVCSFNEPITTLAAGDFQQRWSSLSTGNQEAVEVLRPSYPINPSQTAAALTTALKFGKVSGMPDSSDYVLYGVASLRTGAKGTNGENISVGCMVKLEMNVQANALRVTLRTVHPAATAALMDTARTLFG